MFISQSNLIEAGFYSEYFAYAIGGGEDENDMTIFIKGDVVVACPYAEGSWFKANYDDLSYTNGFPDNCMPVETMEELEEG